MPNYRYRLTSTGDSSAKYGNCEICKQYASEVFSQVEERRYGFQVKGMFFGGWAYEGDSFGHEECLRSRRKDAK